MADVQLQEPIRTAYKDGSIIISNLRSKVDNASIPFERVFTWYDGSLMDNSKIDQWDVFTKYKPTGEYIRRLLPNWGDKFLPIESFDSLINISAYNLHLVKVGYYKGAQLTGYYPGNPFDSSLVFAWDAFSIDAVDNISIIQVNGVNQGRFKAQFTGYFDANWAGVSSTLTQPENKIIIDKCIRILDNNGGGELFVPRTISYGYKRNTIDTHPNLNSLINDVIVVDESRGNTYTTSPNQRDGAQVRKFYGVAGDVTDAQHDGGGDWFRSNWHPYLFLSNDCDPLTAVRRHATVFFAVNGETYWGIGQGAFSNTNIGTNRDKFMADFKIVGNKLDGKTGLVNVMLVNNLTGRIGFNAVPLSDFHFYMNRNTNPDSPSASINGVAIFENPKGGYVSVQMKIPDHIRSIILRTNGNIEFTADNTSTSVFTIYPDGRIAPTGSIIVPSFGIQMGGLGHKITYGTGNPNSSGVTGSVGSLYIQTDYSFDNSSLWVKSSGSGATGWVQLRGISSGTTTARPLSTNLPVGGQYYDITLGRPVFNNGSNLTNAYPKMAQIPDVATAAAGSVPTKDEFDALLAEFRELKSKLKQNEYLEN